MVKDLIKERFGRIWPAHVANFVDHLIACRKAMGDLDLLLVLAVIGDRTLSQRRTDQTASHDRLFKDKELPEPEIINVQSVSDYTGIARETVRRKVKELIDRGWVAKDAEGYMVATHKAAEDLAPLTEHGIEYLDRMYGLLSGLSKAAD